MYIITEDMIYAVALAIADVREARKGKPGVGDIDWLPYEYREQLKEEAVAAVKAIMEEFNSNIS